MKKRLFEHLAGTTQAWHYCKEHDNPFADTHEEMINYLVDTCMPSGSGIDNGVAMDIEKSNETKLVFTFGYHHMNENGYYDGWTEHKLIVTASLVGGFNMSITGKNRNDIKDYLYQTFDMSLNQIVEVGYSKESDKFYLMDVSNG